MDIEILNTESGQQQFIIADWVRLASLAWKHFLDDGRGAIFLDLRDGAHESNPLYVAQADMINKAMELDMEPNFYAGLGVAADFYDPERQVIFVITRPDGEFADYIHTAPPGPTPPEAFLKQITPSSLDSSEAVIKAITS